MRYPILAVFVFIILVIAAAGSVLVLNRNRSSTSVSISVTPTPEPSVSAPPTLAASAEYSTSSSDVKTDISVNTQSSAQKDSPSPFVKPQSLSDYIYPGSQVKSSTENKLELVSQTDSEEITNWYKDKIRSLNFNAKSFTQTNTNGVILNKLSAAKPDEKIEITIKKDQNASDVYITVDRP